MHFNQMKSWILGNVTSCTVNVFIVEDVEKVDFCERRCCSYNANLELAWRFHGP